jgi:5-methylcytosine-specific restriction enzyme subunit McrC
LSAEELAELQSVPARLTIQPRGDRYVVTPSSVVGAATTLHLHVVVEPKLPIDRVFYLLGYAKRIRFAAETTPLAARPDLVEPFVAAFLDALQRALRRGLPMSYVAREEALPTIRGRVRFAEQFRRRYDLPLPVEIGYDDYTIDTEANRLVKAALRRIEQLRLRRASSRRRTAEALVAFDGVSDTGFNPRRLPVFSFTRLNERYRTVLELAALIVRSTSVELHPGATPTSSILFDMNIVFEDFVWAAMDDEMRRLLPPVYRWKQGKSIALDEGNVVRTEPDLSLWRGSRCVFVGDAKYKDTDQGEAGDLYQLLAYCSATGLAEGLLLYAQTPDEPTVHQVVRGGPRLRVETVDVSAPVEQLHERLRSLAHEIAHQALATAA